jgi:hypothetical protein
VPPACWWAMQWESSDLEGLQHPPQTMPLTPHQRKRILQLVIPLSVLFIAEKIHNGLGRAILGFGSISLVVYCFVNDDKPWARRILNSPKKWWQ